MATDEVLLEWMTHEYFIKVLKEFEGRDVELKEFLIKSGTNKGENFASAIYRVQLTYILLNDVDATKTCSFILKTSSANSSISEMLEDFQVFEGETQLYKKILVECSKLIGDNIKFAPSSLSVVNTRPQPKYIMLEEFASKGYKKVDQKNGLNVDHLKLVLEKLAKLHAASAMLYNQDETDFMNHQEPNISEYFKIFHPLFFNCLNACAKAAEKWPGAEEFSKKLFVLEKNVIDRGSEAFILDDEEFGVLCHGDLWANNVMFDYNEKNEPNDAIMLDFGLSYFSSPGIDLSYLIFTSSSNDIKDYEIDILLQHYHQHLHANLIKMNCKRSIPALTDIHNHFLKRGIVGVIYSTLLIPLRFAENINVKELTGLVTSTDEGLSFRDGLYESSQLQERMMFLLNYFDRKGLLD
ncbi:unnamed protein product [Diamesa tonsa]